MTTRISRRRTIAALASIALVLPLGACGDLVVSPAQATATPSARPQSPVRPKPPAKTRAHVKTTPRTTAKPHTATRPPVGTDLFGTQYAYLKSAKANRLTFDLVQYFEGPAAGKACDADHVAGGEGVWCVDYYIRNFNPRPRTLGADPYGPYRLLTDEGPVKVSLWTFIAALRGRDRVFKFYVDGGRILHADEVPA